MINYNFIFNVSFFQGMFETTETLPLLLASYKKKREQSLVTKITQFLKSRNSSAIKNGIEFCKTDTCDLRQHSDASAA